MIIYKVFSKDYEHEKVKLLGMLAERRKDLRGEKRVRRRSELGQDSVRQYSIR
jgi:hypothetical protein